ncbi:STAS domain-containing protein [Candidatus Sumerlaeota bacterium]|nr:STAS domain-containing protein [Candidatus Sumerlaeota bacterium]
MITARDVPEKGARVLRICGDLGNEAMNEFVEELGDLLGMDGGRVVLDFAEVGMLCSRALGALVQSHQRFTQRRGGHILIAAPDPNVEQVLRVTNLHRVMPIHPSVEGALETFASSTIPLTRRGTAPESR